MRITTQLETLSRPAWVALVATCLLPAIGGLFAADLWLVICVILSVPAGFLLGHGAVARHLASRLPLAFAEAALRGSSMGRPVYRFRVRLGRGRLMKSARARVVFRTHEARHELPLVLDQMDALVGPWTLLARDPEGVVGPGGVFDVDVRGLAGDEEVMASASWDEATLREGTFEPGMLVQKGRLHIDPDAWERVR